MKIKMNDKEYELHESISIYDFLSSNNQNPTKVVVEYNGTVPKRADWTGIYLQEGDNLIVLKFVGGG